MIIVHLFGLALGAGAAFFSDFLFTDILKDRRISKDEFRLIQLASRVVWIGLAVLFVSGLVLFLGDVDRYLDSSKFLAKMSIVLVAAINGVVFHFKHFKLLEKLVGKDLSKDKSAGEILKPMFVSGAVSGVSWAAALILGSLSFVSWGYWTIIGLYAGGVVLAALAAVFINGIYFPAKPGDSS